SSGSSTTTTSVSPLRSRGGSSLSSSRVTTTLRTSVEGILPEPARDLRRRVVRGDLAHADRADFVFRTSCGRVRARAREEVRLHFGEVEGEEHVARRDPRGDARARADAAARARDLDVVAERNAEVRRVVRVDLDPVLALELEISRAPRLGARVVVRE